MSPDEDSGRCSALSLRSGARAVCRAAPVVHIEPNGHAAGTALLPSACASPPAQAASAPDEGTCSCPHPVPGAAHAGSAAPAVTLLRRGQGGAMRAGLGVSMSRPGLIKHLHTHRPGPARLACDRRSEIHRAERAATCHRRAGGTVSTGEGCPTNQASPGGG
eukprot:scaffold685_cov324-Prasinococcus_capsulatus_cf.AAC.12